MHGVINLITEFIIDAGIGREFIFHNSALELPGFFRPTKKWDLLVVKREQLILALEAKSLIGPSFGNNYNNRTEEAAGSAVDLWTAFRDGAFNKTVKPWLGYIFLLEDCEKTKKGVRVKEPHFPVFKEFKDSSYSLRCELLCRKLVRERLYNVATFLTSPRTAGNTGEYLEPAGDLTFEIFIKSLIAQVKTFGD